MKSRFAKHRNNINQLLNTSRHSNLDAIVSTLQQHFTLEVQETLLFSGLHGTNLDVGKENSLVH
jgi:hypothetical protein